MSGIALNIINNFIEVSNTSSLAEISGNTLSSGQLACSDDSGFYQFDPTVLNLGSNDILLDDNSGIWRQYTAPFIYLNSSNQITNLNTTTSSYYIAAQGSISGSSTDDATLTLTVEEALVSDYLFTQIQTIDIPCFLFNETQVSANGQINVTFTEIPNSYVINYMLVRANAILNTNLTYNIMALTDFSQITTYSNAAAMQAITTNPQSGSMAYSLTGGLYYFDINVLNVGENDLVLTNNTGTWRYSSNPYIYIDDDNIVSTNNFLPDNLLAHGNATGNTENESVTVSGLTSVSTGDLVFLQWNNIPEEAYTSVSCGTNSFTVTSSEAFGSYNFNYLVFSTST